MLFNQMRCNSSSRTALFVTGQANTEDVYFCLRTRELDPMPEIFLHTGIECGHLLNPEPIEFKTRKLLVKYYEDLAKLAKEEIVSSRDLNYIQDQVANLQNA